MSNTQVKNLYCVRHAQSETNKTGVRLGPEGKLSEQGYEEASVVAQRVARIAPDIILTSSAVRAAETARVISEETNIPLEVIDEAKERTYPSELLGKSTKDPEAKEMYAKYRELFSTGGRMSDEETFDELTGRVDVLMDIIAARPETNMVLVTHHFLLKVLLARVIFGEKLVGENIFQLYDSLYCNNTGITHFQVGERWRMITWNDRVHLG